MTLRKAGSLLLGCLGVALLFWGVVLPQFSRKKADESLESISQPAPEVIQNNAGDNLQQPTPTLSTLASGSFRNLNGQRTSGVVSIIKNESGKLFARLEDDFKVSSGPDLYVGFGNNGRVDESSLLPKLKAFSGSQNYELPDGFDVSKYTQAFIYCRAFAYPFGAADLNKLGEEI